MLQRIHKYSYVGGHAHTIEMAYSSCCTSDIQFICSFRILGELML